MQPRSNRLCPFLAAIGLLAMFIQPALAATKNYGELSTALNVSALQPGKKAMLAVVFKVKEGYHTQSNTPSSTDYVKFEVKVDVNDAFAAKEPVYPKGEDHVYDGIKLNVYEGTAIVRIPIEMKADAALGEVKISGTISYQACKKAECYEPVTTKWELATKIVGAGETVTAVNKELFEEAATKPTTKPAAAPPEGTPKTERSWGEWFQNPWFVWPVTVILVVMALGMFGLFTFRLPLGVYTIEPKHDTVSGNFLFGILTAVLSTPCTAPLFPGILAWAVVQAKSGGRWIGVGVIAMVGVGMALPYLILSAFPELARRVPRTGPWSELVKQFMGFLILGVAVYFAGQQVLAGNQFMWGVFAIAIAGGIFLIVRTMQLMPRPRPVVIAIVLAIGMSWGSFTLAQTLNRKSPVEWIHFSDEELAKARASGKITLVKFTANWCANCQLIEATVYNDPIALNAVKSHDVTMIKADLTKQDAPGKSLLNELNPSGGIPWTAIYSPRRPEPYALKSIYRTPTLLAALNAAETGAPFQEDGGDKSALWAFSIALLVGVIFNVMPCVLPVLPLKAIGFYEVSQHNRGRSLMFGAVFSLGIITTFAALALLVLPVTKGS